MEIRTIQVIICSIVLYFLFQIWIFGLVERQSNTLILYPVQDRSENTLVPLIQKHVMEGSTIYSDGWAAYSKLNELSYQHFTVLHSESFKKVYRFVTISYKNISDT